MIEQFPQLSAASSEAERFEAIRTVSFATIVNGVEIEFAVTVPWAHDPESDEHIASDVAAETPEARAERVPQSA
ncbi:MAG: hypothetical protein QM651_10475 [Rhodoblastus sp.]